MADEAIRIPIEIDPTKGIAGLTGLDNSAKKTFSDIQKGAAGASAGIAKIVPITGQANNALINTGRIFQDLPFGIIGISNNINPLIESFQRLKASAAETGVSIKSQLIASLAGGGGLGLIASVATGALGFLTLGLSAFTRGLISNKEAADVASESLTKYNDILEKIKATSQSIKGEIDFSNELGNINNQIAGFGSIEDLEQQSISQREFTQKIIDQQEKVRKSIDEINDDESLSDKERIELKQKFNKELFDLFTQENDSRNKQTIIYRKIARQQQVDAKAASDKSLDQLKDLISKAKVIQDRFPALVPNKIDELFDSFSDQVKKASVIVKDFELSFPNVHGGGAKQINVPEIVVPTATIKILSPEFIIGPSKGLTDALDKGLHPEEIAKRFKQLTEGVNNARSFEGILRALENLKQYGDEVGIALGGISENIANTAILVDSTLTPAFENLFQAIISGDDPLKAFFNGLIQSINAVIQKLIQAAIEAAILSIITGGASGGGLSFASAFKTVLGFRAGGGSVMGGGAYIVGEKGPELFVPNQTGTIVPNGAAIAGGTQNIVVTGVLRGKDIILSNERTTRSQRRVA